MAADRSTKPPSNGSLLPLVLQLLSERVGSMEARILNIERVLMTRSAALWSSEEAGSMGTGQSIWSRLKAAVTVASLLHKAWQMLRLVPWVGMAMEGLRLLLRWFGH